MKDFYLDDNFIRSSKSQLDMQLSSSQPARIGYECWPVIFIATCNGISVCCDFNNKVRKVNLIC